MRPPSTTEPFYTHIRCIKELLPKEFTYDFLNVYYLAFVPDIEVRLVKGKCIYRKTYNYTQSPIEIAEDFAKFMKPYTYLYTCLIAPIL